MTYKKNSPSNKTDWITPKYIIDALVAYGEHNVIALQESGLGHVVRLEN